MRVRFAEPQSVVISLRDMNAKQFMAVRQQRRQNEQQQQQAQLVAGFSFKKIGSAFKKIEKVKEVRKITKVADVAKKIPSTLKDVATNPIGFVKGLPVVGDIAGKVIDAVPGVLNKTLGVLGSLLGFLLPAAPTPEQQQQNQMIMIGLVVLAILILPKLLRAAGPGAKLRMIRG